MGSPLAPILANWFVAKIEDRILNDTTISQPKFYRRYVDDIFAIFESEDHRDQFFHHLNNSHQNLQFTMEPMNASTKFLPFLDVNVRIEPAGDLVTKVYRKPTNTGVLMSYDAIAPMNWKRSIIKGFLNRAKKITSSTELFNSEVAHIKSEFEKNGYPTTFIEKTIVDFKLTDRTRTTTSNVQSDKNSSQSFYFVLPYVGKPSEKLQKRIKTELSQHDVIIKSAYRTTKIESFFSLKTATPPLLKSDVVYMFTCPCEKDGHHDSYVGETQRQLFKRVEEHIKSTTSAIYQHRQNCAKCAQNTNIIQCFETIKKSHRKNVFYEEAFYIKKLAPSLNVQMGPNKGAFVQTQIFK